MLIALFAGAFDPIHLGHTDFIKRAIDDNGLDKVYLLIEREPKYKTCIATYNDRKKMVSLAISDIPQAEIYETQSATFPLSASLPTIKKANPKARLFALMGDDVAAHIKEWEDERGLLKDVELIVADRGTDEINAGVSSLKIRNKIAVGKKPELNSEVLDYIKKHKIY